MSSKNFNKDFEKYFGKSFKEDSGFEYNTHNSFDASSQSNGSFLKSLDESLPIEQLKQKLQDKRIQHQIETLTEKLAALFKYEQTPEAAAAAAEEEKEGELDPTKEILSALKANEAENPDCYYNVIKLIDQCDRMSEEDMNNKIEELLRSANENHIDLIKQALNSMRNRPCDQALLKLKPCELTPEKIREITRDGDLEDSIGSGSDSRTGSGIFRVSNSDNQLRYGGRFEDLRPVAASNFLIFNPNQLMKILEALNQGVIDEQLSHFAAIQAVNVYLNNVKEDNNDHGTIAVLRKTNEQCPATNLSFDDYKQHLIDAIGSNNDNGQRLSHVSTRDSTASTLCAYHDRPTGSTTSSP